MHRDVILWSGIKPVHRYGRKELYRSLSRPIGSYQLASWLRKFRFSVQVIEFIQLLSAEEIVAMTEPFITPKTICIGLSRTFLGRAGAWGENIVQAVNILRSKYPNLKFVSGGQETNGGITSEIAEDKVFIGYGEDVFLKWCQEQKYGVALPNQAFHIKDLDHRFIPDDIILQGEMLPIELGRGCIFKCKFCSYSMIGKEKGSYLRDHSLLIDEMKYNKDTFGVDKYMFMDDTTNEDYDKVARFANFEKDLGFPINWIGYCRADLIWARQESAEQLQQSGLVSPFFGIETFERKAAQFIGKGWSAAKAKDWLPVLYHDIWGRKINLCVAMIVGLPYAKDDNILDVVKWWNSNNMGRIKFSVFGMQNKVPDGEPDNRSEISKGAEALGYRFLEQTKDGVWQWDSPNGTSYRAARIASQAMFATTPRQRVASWSIADGVALGFDIPSTLQMKSREVEDPGLIMTNAFKRKYISQFAKYHDLPHLPDKITWLTD